MPTISAHVSDEEEKQIRAAAAASPEKKVAPFVAEAVRQRIAREMPAAKLDELRRALLVAAAELAPRDEVAALERAVAAVRREARRSAKRFDGRAK